jgi:hypothetical protein
MRAFETCCGALGTRPDHAFSSLGAGNARFVKSNLELSSRTRRYPVISFCCTTKIEEMSGALPLRERASRKFSKLHKSLTKPVCGTANRKLHRRCNHGSPPARTILQRVLKEYSPRLPRSALAAPAAIDPADPIPYQFHPVAVDDRSRQRRHLAAAAVRDTIEQPGPLRAGGRDQPRVECPRCLGRMRILATIAFGQ